MFEKIKSKLMPNGALPKGFESGSSTEGPIDTDTNSTNSENLTVSSENAEQINEEITEETEEGTLERNEKESKEEFEKKFKANKPGVYINNSYF